MVLRALLNLLKDLPRLLPDVKSRPKDSVYNQAASEYVLESV